MGRAEFFRHRQRPGIVEALAAIFDRLVEAEQAEIAQLFEQVMRGENPGLLPFVDEGD
jgi:hypothetical protein